MATDDADDGFDFGQKESLTTRLKTLVRDYPEGLGIVKELLQNADDSRARILHLIFDWRTHPADQLRNPRLAQLQGPALLACNDRAFTESDFVNITNLSSAGKLKDATKTGRFGQGFNSVYNLTDFPCFVTADRLAIFDPHRAVVAHEAHGGPGRAWKLSPDNWRTHGQLLEPFVAGGLSRGTEFSDRTVFRLPFRDAAQAQRSEIARKTFGHANADEIIAEVLKAREQLLLFVKFLEEFRVSQITEDGRRQDLLTITTENTAEVRNARAPLIQALEGDLHEVFDRLESGESPEASVFEHRFKIVTGSASESVSWQIVSGLFVDEGGDLLRAARELQGNDERAVPWAGVAACLEGGRIADNGLAYCSLPLPIETGLPVHLHGLFDLDTSRSALTTIGGQTGRDRVRGEWNQLLLRHGVAAAYTELIVSLAPSVGESDPARYYALWPTRPLSKPFDELSAAFVEKVEDRPVFRSAGSDRWVSAFGMWVLPEDWIKLQSPLVADEFPVADPILPDPVRLLLKNAEIELDELSPEELRKHLRDPEFVAVSYAEAGPVCLRRREWLVSLLRFAVSDEDEAALEHVPLALLADGNLQIFGGTRGTLYIADDEERTIFASRPHWFLDPTFVRDCELDEMTDAGVERMTPATLLEKLAEFVGLEVDASHRTWLITDAEPPNAEWLCLVYRYLTPAFEHGFSLDVKVSNHLGLVPARGHRLFAPGFYYTPLLPPPDLSEATRVALMAYGVTLVEAPPELRQAIISFVTLNAGIWIWPLTGPDVVGALADLDELPPCDEPMHLRLMEFLTDRRWLDGETGGYKDEHLDQLRHLPLFLTTSGQRVAIDEQTYLPTDLQTDLPVTLNLLDPGPDGAWLPLYRRLGVPRLDRAVFVERGILADYRAFDDGTRLRALQWLRDHLGSTQTDLEAEKGAYESLLQKIENTALIRCTDGEYRMPRRIYDPRPEIVHEILETSVPFPDTAKTYAASREHWLKFFVDIGLVTQPEALAIILRVDKLIDDSKQGGTANVSRPLMSIYRHVAGRWHELRDRPIPLTNGTTSPFAAVLRSRAWLPVERDAATLSGYAAFMVPEDRLYRPAEVCFSGRPAYLAASQRPVFRGREPELSARKEFGFVPIGVDTVVAQLDAAVERWENESGPLGETFENSLQPIYRELKKSAEQEDDDALPLEVDLVEHYAGQHCLWHEGRFWPPEHAFRAAVSYFGARRVTIPTKRRDLYGVLGMRTEPGIADFVSFLEEVAAEAGAAPVPETERSNVVKVLKHLGAALGDAEPDDSIKVLTTTGRLVPGREVFSPDAAWLEERLDRAAIHLLLPELRVGIERAAGVRSLQRSVREQPAGEFVSIHEGEGSEAVRAWEQTLRSLEFADGLRRLAAHKDGTLEPETTERLADLRIDLTPQIVTNLFVILNGADTHVGSGALSDSFFDADGNTVYLAKQKTRFLLINLVKVLVTQVVASSLLDGMLVSEMLQTAPEEIDALLDGLKIRRPAAASESGDDREPIYEQAEEPADQSEVAKEDIASAQSDEVDEPDNRPDQLDGGTAPDRETETSPVGSSGGGGRRGRGAFSGPRATRKPYPQHEVGDRAPTPVSRLPVAAAATQKRQDRVVTYVVGGRPAVPGTEARTSDPEEDDAADKSWKIKFGQQGVDLVCGYERDRGRQPQPMGQTSPGYDVESHDPTTNTTRLIEVKSVHGVWSPRGVAVSRTQHSSAMAHRDRYWLYVVERAEDPANAVIHPIHDPFGKIQQYLFDDGWRGLAATEPLAATNLFPREGGRVTVEDHGEGVVENVRTRGALTLLKIILVDGQSMLIPFNPDTVRPLD